MTDTNFTFTDKSFEDAIEILQDLKRRRRDVVAKISDLEMHGSGTISIGEIRDGDGGMLNVAVKPNPLAHRQIATRLNIPFKYWNRMTEELPALAALNFNSWVQKEDEDLGNKQRKVFVRSYMDEPGGNFGTMRAILSNSYFPVDNLTLITEIVKIIQEMKSRHDIDIRVSKCSLSDSRLYLKFVSPTIQTEAREILKNYRDPNSGEYGGLGTDHGIVSGFIVTNSEVGLSQLAVSPMVTFKACMNNMIWKEYAFTRRHVGEKLDMGVYKADTKRSNLETIKLQVRDHIQQFLDPEFMGQQMKTIEEMAARKLDHPIQCVKNMAHELGLGDSEIESVLNTFLRQGANENVFDVAQAFTGYAHQLPHDRKIELETASTGILKLADKCDVAEFSNN